MRTTKKAMDEYKDGNFALILGSTFFASGEGFTVSDIRHFLSKLGDPICHGVVGLYLKELVDMGRLNRVSCKVGAKSGTYVYSRKPPNILRKSWRFTSDSDLGILSELAAETASP